MNAIFALKNGKIIFKGCGRNDGVEITKNNSHRFVLRNWGFNWTSKFSGTLKI